LSSFKHGGILIETMGGNSHFDVILILQISMRNNQNLKSTNIRFRAPTTLKSEGEVTSLSGVDKREVRDNREKSKYFYNCTTFHIRGALSWHSYVIIYLLCIKVYSVVV
jgi:hypothetical protein